MKNQIEHNVRSLLKTYKESRINDRNLIWLYYSIYHDVHTFSGYAVLGSKIPSIATITRYKRKIQAKGLYLYPLDADDN
jgi:hypothetical protein